MLKQSNWDSPAVNRMCRLSGIYNDALFICKAILIKNPELFSLGMMVILLFYYSVVMRVVETGF